MKNLWEETIEVLKNYSLTWDDVDAVILEDDNVVIPKVNFEEVARKTNYNNGFGRAEIRSDLIIVGWNWWLERAEYDGSEWWELKIKPFIPNEVKEVTSLTGD
jgi:hypothetical protein